MGVRLPLLWRRRFPEVPTHTTAGWCAWSSPTADVLRQVLNQQMANVSEQALSGRSKKDWATLIGFLRQVRDNLM
jgi:hypothetical protein